MKVNEIVITECKSCKSTKLNEKNVEIIDENDIEKFVDISALVCKNCGTIHDKNGEWKQHNFKINEFGYRKTNDLDSSKIENWN
ncbi:MAG: hypothetical protein ACOCP8_09235 [archaeon]